MAGLARFSLPRILMRPGIYRRRCTSIRKSTTTMSRRKTSGTSRPFRRLRIGTKNNRNYSKRKSMIYRDLTCVVLGDQDGWGTNRLSKAESILGTGMSQNLSRGRRHAWVSRVNLKAVWIIPGIGRITESAVPGLAAGAACRALVAQVVMKGGLSLRPFGSVQLIGLNRGSGKTGQQPCHDDR